MHSELGQEWSFVEIYLVAKVCKSIDSYYTNCCVFNIELPSNIPSDIGSMRVTFVKL